MCFQRPLAVPPARTPTVYLIHFLNQTQVLIQETLKLTLLMGEINDCRDHNRINESRPDEYIVGLLAQAGRKAS